MIYISSLLTNIYLSKNMRVAHSQIGITYNTVCEETYWALMK